MALGKSLTDATKVNPSPAAEVPSLHSQAARVLRTAVPHLEKAVLRFVRLQEQVDAAFGGQPFLPDASPISSKNIQRYNAYFRMLRVPTRLMTDLIDELLRIRAVEPDTPYPLAPGAIGPEVRQRVFTEDALLLAEHLTQHAHTFKKPLPPFVESDCGNKSENESKRKNRQ
jgi:hypothetical protein